MYKPLLPAAAALLVLFTSPTQAADRPAVVECPVDNHMTATELAEARRADSLIRWSDSVPDSKLNAYSLPRADPTGRNEGDDCSNPLTLELNYATYPIFLPDQTTCGRGNNYDSTCLGMYDGGEDIVYEFIVTQPAVVSIVIDPKGTAWTGLMLATSCPADDGFACIDTSTSNGSTLHGIDFILLEEGVYYLMVDTWPSPDCIPSFDLEVIPINDQVFEGDNCDMPIELDFPQPLPLILDGQYTCGRENYYDQSLFCLPNYGGGEEVVYQLNITEPTDFVIIMDPKGTTWTYGQIGTDCPPVPGECLYHFRNTGSSVYASDWMIFEPGTYYLLIDTWPSPDCIPDFDLYIMQPWHCVFCEDSWVDEGETCGDWANDGCNLGSPSFGTIGPGDTVCGLSYAHDGERDTDWFAFSLSEWAEVTLHALADFPAVIGIVETDPLGVADCGSITGNLNPYAEIPSCSEGSVSGQLPPGDYWAYIAPNALNGYPCIDDWRYQLALIADSSVTEPCAASGGCDEYISRVAFLDIDTATACDGYRYFDAQQDVIPGQTFDITVEIGNAYASDQTGLWINWDQGFTFDADEYYYLGQGGGPFMHTISVPDSIPGGLIGMRIRLCYNETPQPCGMTQFGEVEDYILQVQPPPVVATDPTLLWAADQFSLTQWNLYIFVGGSFAPGYTVDNIDLSAPTVINDTLLADEAEIDWHPDFEEQVLRGRIDGRIFLANYAPIWDSSSHSFTIGGWFNDGETYVVHGEIMIRGHIPGDLNLDGVVNISDLTAMTGFLFMGAAPPIVPAVADVNASGDINIADLTYFVAYLFSDGQPLQHP